LRRIDELMVEGNRKHSSQSERNDDSSGSDDDGGTPIAADDGCVDLETHEKEEEAESDVGNEREVW